MVQIIQARDITLHDLKTKFGLHLVQNDQFFREWLDDLPELTDMERQRLDRVKACYINLLEYPPLLENTVKMVVLSPLLDLADLYLPPFHISSEKSVEFFEEDEGIMLRGQMDVLGLKERLWVMVIESKQAAFSIEAGLAQLLAYMLGNPNPYRPTFGMITTGGSFIFLKLVKGEITQYATSDLFGIFNLTNNLYNVLRILKRLAQLALE